MHEWQLIHIECTRFHNYMWGEEGVGLIKGETVLLRLIMLVFLSDL